MNGKGDDPRNCHTDAFREGYDEINWHRKPTSTPAPKIPLGVITVIDTSDENARHIKECADLVDHVSALLRGKKI